MAIKSSELILNADGSIYHLNLQPNSIADTIIFVGDPDRVDMVTDNFDRIEFSTQKREFKTVTGYYKSKQLTVISTGIGPDNIDIVLNELDALVNIDFKTRKIKPQLKQLNIVRIGTSGALQPHIPVDSFLISTHALDINGMLSSYNTETLEHQDFENAFVAHTQWNFNSAKPVLVANSKTLQSVFDTETIVKGITCTAGGFYAPQGRQLRLQPKHVGLNLKLQSFNYKGQKLTNLEMETSAIYGLSKLLGHRAISLNAILANRANGTFSKTPQKTTAQLITFALHKILAL